MGSTRKRIGIKAEPGAKNGSRPELDLAMEARLRKAKKKGATLLSPWPCQGACSRACFPMGGSNLSVYSSRKHYPWYPKSTPGFGHREPIDPSLVTAKSGQRERKSCRRLTVFAVTEGSAKKSSKSGEESIPSWAKPDSDEPPPWARDEAGQNASEQTFEIPFFVYLLASAITAIAAIGSVFEYLNQRPVFGIVNPDSVFYAPLLGFFAFTGIPSSAFLWFKSVQAANKEAEEQDRRDGYRAHINCCGSADVMLSETEEALKVIPIIPLINDKTDEERSKQVQRGQWLRAAILGANDGLISTTSLMLGVGAAKEDQRAMILSGLAGALAGACSMAVGEFVSVSTQRDIEKTMIDNCNSKTGSCRGDDGGDIKLHISTGSIETKPAETNLAMSPPMTPGWKLPLIFSPARSPMLRVLAEDAKISSPARSPTVKVIAEDAKTRMGQEGKKDDNDEAALPNPYKASAASAMAFLCGSLVPLFPAMFHVHSATRIVIIVVVASMALAIFGALGAHLGGSPIRKSAVRVLLGGWLSMALTYGLLKPFDRDDHKGQHDTD
ncbi:hypothetical protein F0562_004054 [Nyssa sinensis]|uniref:Uncharacterized protein n=1 Tax=Nyssa sinensis TaxID=561372 RepID=A0A5J5BX53_9ASTE|nr:hypothetical protein F0562_004054 [Nyssa sinensis]